MTRVNNFNDISLSIETLRSGYLNNQFTVIDVVLEVIRRVKKEQDGIWTLLVDEDKLISRAKYLMHQDVEELPLFGIPFSVKDNIHIRGIPTTASCKSLSFEPLKTADSVQHLLDSGAILIGKNTMDQFATGLVGIRSHIYPVNPFNQEYIPGGSSSGSAVAVATGLVSFSLGSDTGGSGRIPAALNNIVGLKPTPGVISIEGMIYANRSFDCMPIFALLCGDAKTIFDLIYRIDNTDSFCGDYTEEKINQYPCDFSNLKAAIPNSNHLNFFGDDLAKNSFELSVKRLRKLGAEIVEIDFSDFIQAGKKIFEGPILSERYASIKSYIDDESELDQNVKNIIEKAKNYSAVDLYEETYEISDIRARVRKKFEDFDFIFVPTAPTIYKISEVEKNPITLNTNMGYYTYFVNILNLSALALPSEIRQDGLPFGICMIGKPRTDEMLLQLGEIWQKETNLFLGKKLKSFN